MGIWYLILLIGIGGSALLSQQILIDSHLKYKDYNIKKIRVDLKKKIILDSRNPGKELKSINDEQNELLIKNNKNRYEREKKIGEKREERLKKREKNKIICLTMTIGYFGKYAINLLIDYIL